MTHSMSSGAFVAYAVTCLILCANLFALWAYSGAVRNRTRKAINAEDAAFYKMDLVEIEAPAVARVLRAHRNAEATIYPFLLLGLAFVMAGGSATAAWILFGVFAAARIAHSIAYLAGAQPWRTAFFVVSGLAALALMAALVIRLV